MNREEYLKGAPYTAGQAEKEAFFREEMHQLSERHRAGCPDYARLCSALGEDTPLLPVSAFRDRKLFSVPEESIVRVLTSSGTSGQAPSRIYLDAEGAAAQQITLARILQDYLGKDRLPMLIIDSRNVFRDPSAYTARGAGIAGFSVFSTSRTYALDENMQPDMDAVVQFAEKHKGEKVLLFGFTFMIRQYFILPLLEAGIHPDLSGAVLIHGGGWKKMTELAVSPEQFKEELYRAAGIREVHNYYGMAEQLGSIFMECECGHLHASRFADIQVLHPGDFSPCRPGEQGVISLSSVLPESYPGHRILTEDLGRILGTDDCPCGRKGVYFAVDGRVPKAEVRGCSDTWAAELDRRAQEKTAAGTGGHSTGEAAMPPGDAAGRTDTMTAAADAAVSAMTIAAGNYPLTAGPLPAFSETVMDGLAALSAQILHDPACRAFPETITFAFWLRRAHLEQLRERWPEARTGLGQILITAPGNMPSLFAYNWAVAMLAGCSAVIRIPEKQNALTELLCGKIRGLFADSAYAALAERTAVVRFPRSDEQIAALSQEADARVIWGGDRTVAHLSAIAAKEGCRDILFPDRYGISVLSVSAVAALSDDGLVQLCDRFYRDTYEADQNACSSARVVFWVTDAAADDADTPAKDADAAAEDVRRRWWQTLSSIVRERYRPEAATLLAKYALVTRQAMDLEGLRVHAKAGNLLTTADLSGNVPWDTLEARFGLFYELVLPSLADFPADLGGRLQTAAVYGFSVDQVRGALEKCRRYEALRVVPVGEALSFDPVWENKDLIRLLSKQTPR